MCSQVLDTLIFSLIAWWGTVDLVTALKLGAAKYVFKLDEEGGATTPTSGNGAAA